MRRKTIKIPIRARLEIRTELRIRSTQRQGAVHIDDLCASAFQHGQQIARQYPQAQEAELKSHLDAYIKEEGWEDATIIEELTEALWEGVHDIRQELDSF